MKGFVKHLLVFSLALVLGWGSALLHVAEVEQSMEQMHETSTPYTLVDHETPQHPVQSFVAIVPAERMAVVNPVRFPSSPVAERMGGSNTVFASAQQCCCQLVALREKSMRHDYEGYKAQMCSHGHYLYSLCQMLI